MRRLILLGLNHTTAPLEVREKLAFNESQCRAALGALRRRFPNCEAIIVSTCNRVELYVAREVHAHPRIEEMIDFLSRFHSVPADAFRSHLYEKSERGVVEHLFSVASSLDSMVLGETQILGQVRAAYDVARELSSAGSLLNPLFQRALAVGKQVMRETALNDGRLSIASVAVDHARRIFDRFGDKTVLTIGAGKMTAVVLRGFAALATGRLLVCNRDPLKAGALARQFAGESAPFEQLENHLVAADLVVTSTGSSRPIVTRKLFEPLLKARRHRPIFIIDIAIPRDVEAETGTLDNVHLYNLDDLQQVVSSTQSRRKEAIDAARAIVASHVDGFLAWHRAREAGPLIDALSRRYHQAAREELDRILNKMPDMTDAERSHLEELTRRIVNKLLHDPITTLRATGAVHAIEKLFKLKEEGTLPTDERHDGK